MQRYCLRFDDDCHDYLLPVELADEFDDLLMQWDAAGWKTDASEPIEALFEEKFSQYRVDNLLARITFALPQVDGEELP